MDWADGGKSSPPMPTSVRSGGGSSPTSLSLPTVTSTSGSGLEATTTTNRTGSKRMAAVTSTSAPGGDTAAAAPALDEARAAYGALYAEAEGIAQSSVMAGRIRKAKPATASASLRVRIARRVPARFRKRLRSAFGRRS